MSNFNAPTHMETIKKKQKQETRKRYRTNTETKQIFIGKAKKKRKHKNWCLMKELKIEQDKLGITILELRDRKSVV